MNLQGRLGNVSARLSDHQSWAGIWAADLALTLWTLLLGRERTGRVLRPFMKLRLGRRPDDELSRIHRMRNKIFNLWEQRWSWQQRFQKHEQALQRIIGAKVKPWSYVFHKPSKPEPAQSELLLQNRVLTEKIMREQLKATARPRSPDYRTSTASRRKALQRQTHVQNQKLFLRVTNSRTTIAKPATPSSPRRPRLLLERSQPGKTTPVAPSYEKIAFEFTKVLSDGRQCYILVRSGPKCVTIYAFCEIDQQNQFREKYVSRIPVQVFNQLIKQRFQGKLAELASAVEITEDGLSLTLATGRKQAGSLNLLTSDSKARTAQTAASIGKTGSRRFQRRQQAQIPEQSEFRQAGDENLATEQLQAVRQSKRGRMQVQIDTARLIESSSRLQWGKNQAKVQKKEEIRRRKKRDCSDSSSLSQDFDQMLVS